MAKKTARSKKSTVDSDTPETQSQSAPDDVEAEPSVFRSSAENLDTIENHIEEDVPVPPESEEAPNDAKKPRGKKRRSPTAEGEEKPKRHLNAFMLFCKDERPKFKNSSKPVTEIAQELGRMWRESDEQTKQKYAEMSLAIKSAA
jgi:hypothetical protein